MPPSTAQHTTETALRLLTRRLRMARYSRAAPDDISLSTSIAVPATTRTLKRVSSASNGTAASTTPESTNGMAIVLSPMATKPTMTMKARSIATHAVGYVRYVLNNKWRRLLVLRNRRDEIQLARDRWGHLNPRWTAKGHVRAGFWRQS